MADIAGSKLTTASIAVGGTASSALETMGDHDWFKLELTAGQKVTITLDGVTLEDPYLRIRDSNGNVIFENDDISSGTIRDSKLTFTAPTSGTYYVDVGAFDEAYTGTYQLSVQPYTPPPLATYDEIADHLVNGYWGGASHHFNVGPGGTINVNLTQLTAAGQTLAREALALWSDVIGVTFREVTTGGQITFDDNEDGAHADANWGTNGITTSAHINVSSQWLADYGTKINSYSFQTYVHEIGHALGLGHGGHYNGEATYSNDALFLNDGWSTTVMSYFDQRDNDYFADQGFSRAFAVTPMMADVIAMGTLYGLSTTTRTGDTTYGFNSTAGRDVFNASLQPNVAYTIVDSGGVDTLDYSGFTADQKINLEAETFSDVGTLNGNVAIARGTVIENAIGGSGNDQLLGNGVGNRLEGRAGNDELRGNAGNDELDGGIGDDRMYGGLGDDSFFVDSSGDSTIEYSGQGIDHVHSTLTHKLGANIENLTLLGTSAIDGTGNKLANILIGNSAANVLNGLGGADSMRGGEGNDLYIVNAAGDSVVELSGQGTDQVEASVGHTLAANVENLTLTGTARINGTGNSMVNILIGNAAANVLNGLAGADTMRGGLGNDTYIVDNKGDVVTEASNAGTDLVKSYISYTLALNVEKLTLVGTASINGIGNGLANVIIGNAAANILSGKGGADTMKGGRGNDIYIVDNSADIVVERSTGGIDLVKASASFTLRAYTENLTLVGTAAINGTGNGGANVITGNGAANLLSGGAGADTLKGLGGADTLNGGLGNDTLIGGAGTDKFLFDTALNASSNVDRITDFSVADDTIVLDQSVFTSLTSLGTLSANAFALGTAALDADDRIIYDSATGKIYYDADGSGAGTAVLFAQVNSGLALTSSDFSIVG